MDITPHPQAAGLPKRAPKKKSKRTRPPEILVILRYPNQVLRACVQPEHRWKAHGKSDAGKLRAICAHCGATVERIEVAR